MSIIILIIIMNLVDGRWMYHVTIIIIIIIISILL
jgi:hypothetical protein